MATTIENLKTAIIGESTAAAMYAAFASKAAQEGYMNISRLFEATSKAERIHAANHTKALVKMGGEPLHYEIAIKVGTTAENLREAAAGETYEFSTMYPPMIETAREEGAKDALRSMTWACEVEIHHERLYAAALAALEAGEEKSLSASYWVCPTCGDTFSSLDGVERCPVCNVPAEKFIKF